MSRRSMGAHGEICERVNGRMMMTVRPAPVVFGEEDLAMYLGYRLGILEGHAYYSEKTQTRADVLGAVAGWEMRHGRLTQKRTLRLINDIYSLGEWEAGTDAFQRFVEGCEAHEAMLSVVRRIFPKFVVEVAA